MVRQTPHDAPPLTSPLADAILSPPPLHLLSPSTKPWPGPVHHRGSVPDPHGQDHQGRCGVRTKGLPLGGGSGRGRGAGIAARGGIHRDFLPPPGGRARQVRPRLGPERAAGALAGAGEGGLSALCGRERGLHEHGGPRGAHPGPKLPPPVPR